MLTPEHVAEIRDWADPRSGIHLGVATRMLTDLLADRAEIVAVLNEVRSLIHSNAVMSGSRWYFSSARGERVHEVCGKVVDVCGKVEGQ